MKEYLVVLNGKRHFMAEIRVAAESADLAQAEVKRQIKLATLGERCQSTIEWTDDTGEKYIGPVTEVEVLAVDPQSL